MNILIKQVFKLLLFLKIILLYISKILNLYKIVLKIKKYYKKYKNIKEYCKK